MNKRIQTYLENLQKLYPDSLDYQYARSLVLLTWSLLTLLVSVLIAAALVTLLRAAGGPVEVKPLFTLALLLGLGLALTIYLVNRGQLYYARLLFTSTLFGLGIIAFAQGTTDVKAGFILIPIVAASMLFGVRGTIVGALIGGLIAAVMWVLESLAGVIHPAPYTPVLAFSGLVFLWAVIVAIGLLLVRFSGSLQSALMSAQHTANQLRAVTEIAQTATDILKADDLLPRLVEMIRERLSFYHVQVFMIDESGREAVLVASTGVAGQQMLARGHRLPVGSRSVIGQVTQFGQYVYATDTSIDPVHRRNEFLPATRSELALPLRDGVQVIGALDVQSVRPKAFTNEDIDILQVMANQIAIIIRNARLFDQTQTSLEENRRLYAEAQTNLREIERLNRQLTSQVWEGYFEERGQQPGVRVEGATLEQAADWTPTLIRAAQEKQTVVQNESGTTMIAVPIELRGHVIGALEVAVPSDAHQEDIVEMVQVVSRRLALSLDNTRLFEEAQVMAHQEQQINEISGQLQAVNEVDSMLRLALVELRQVLGAGRASIRLRPAEAVPAGNGHK